MEHRSAPPPAANLVMLAGDLLAVAAKQIVIELATARSWEPMQRLKHALEAYEAARIGDTVNPDPQAMTISNWEPETERSVRQ